MIFSDPNCAIMESLRRITFVQKKDIKAVVNPSQSSSVIITDKFRCINNGHSSSEASITFYRLGRLPESFVNNLKSIDTSMTGSGPELSKALHQTRNMVYI